MPIKHIPYEVDETQRKSWYYENLWKKVALELLARHEPSLEGRTLLDYGCGRGETMKFAGGLGMLPSGTDTDPKCVEISSQFGKAVVLEPGNEMAQFGEKSFDVVACFHVLEHVPRPMETLQSLARMAREYVLVAVPNLSRPRDMIRKRNWVDYVNEGHLQSWDHVHFKNLAERFCGLEIVEWGFDATVVPPFSNAIERFFGMKAAIRLETGLFRRLWPYGAVSVIALMKPAPEVSRSAP